MMSDLQLEMAMKRRSELDRSVPDKLSKTLGISSIRDAQLTDPLRNSHAIELTILQTPRNCRATGGKAEAERRTLTLVQLQAPI